MLRAREADRSMEERTMAASSSFLVFLFLFALQRFPAVSGLEIRSFNASISPWIPSKNLTLVSAKRTFAAGFLNRSAACGAGAGLVFSIWVAAAADKTVVWSFNCSSITSGNHSLAVDPAGALSFDGAFLARSSPGGEMKLEEDGQLTFGTWSSFGSPTDTILSNQGFKKELISRNGRYQLVNSSVLVFNRTTSYWGTGSPLKNLSAAGVLSKEDGSSIYAADVEAATLRRVTMDDDGNLRMYSLDPNSGSWTTVWILVGETCKILGFCGENSVCYNNGSTTATLCVCLPGFKRTNSGSCERKIELSSPLESKFLQLDFVDFPDNPKLDLSPLSFHECESRCLKNSSCLAFTYKFTGGRTCTQRSGNMANIYWSPATETATYLRVAAGETAASNFTGMFSVLNTVCPARIQLPIPPKEPKTTARNLSIIGSAFALEILIGVLSFWALLRRYSQYRDMARVLGLELLPAGGPKQFSYSELKSATKDFSDEVGRGGFGIVYRGELSDGRAVAVKRLKDTAGSDSDFWAEANIIARMHHLNLVRLWGFCAEKGQRMLVYEFIPNGSLANYIFSQKGEKKATILDWGMRYRIAVGVARAIAYLHEECLEWVLHRDIKPENILLDGDLCPKVSDFGLAKLTGDKERDWFSRSVGVRGTQGYMAPEWLMPREPITAKADVYSFGMVLLEMVTGARSNQLIYHHHHHDRDPDGLSLSSSSSSGKKTEMEMGMGMGMEMQSEEWYLPVFAYEKVYVEERVEDMIDPRLRGSYDGRAHLGMVQRMLKTAIWCLQERPEMRPSMGKVAKMLEGSVEITEPGKPTIFYLRDS